MEPTMLVEMTHTEVRDAALALAASAARLVETADSREADGLWSRHTADKMRVKAAERMGLANRLHGALASRAGR